MPIRNKLQPIPQNPIGECFAWRDWLQKLVLKSNIEYYINVKDAPFYATGDGITDDYGPIQAALAYAQTIGGTVFFPSGTYVCNSALVMDVGTTWSKHGPRVNLLGAGSSNTRILCQTNNLNFISLGGFGAQYYVAIEGIYFQGPGTVDETGQPTVDGYGTGTCFTIFGSSWSSMTDCVINGWGMGMLLSDSFIMNFKNCFIQRNLQGLKLQGTIYAKPNGISFVGCGVSDNRDYGIQALVATTLTYVGGGVEGNGIGGVDPTFNGGVYVLTGTGGASSANFTGVYFENNAGAADVLIDGQTNASANSFSGCTFNRVTNAHYVTHNIWGKSAAATPVRISVSGCGFAGFGSYVPDAGRVYILADNSDVEVSWIGCYFEDPLETPVGNFAAGGLPPVLLGSCNAAVVIGAGVVVNLPMTLVGTAGSGLSISLGGIRVTKAGTYTLKGQTLVDMSPAPGGAAQVVISINSPIGGFVVTSAVTTGVVVPLTCGCDIVLAANDIVYLAVTATVASTTLYPSNMLSRLSVVGPIA
jgi:hypothetical protein